MATISGPCKWASVKQPNTTFEPCWSIDIILNKEQQKNLEESGFNTKEDKDGDIVLKLKRKVQSMEGKNFDAPDVLNPDGSPFSKLIGNGSIVKVQFSPYEWEAFGNAGKSGWLNTVTVVEHVVYEEADEMDFDTGKLAEKAPVEESFDEDIPF